MHKVYFPGNFPTNYDIEEYCPHCDNYIPVMIDQQDFQNYESKCPVCGERLMLCTLCHDDNGACDWTQENGCFRMHKGLANA